ncbi:MAG: Haloacid dehalogenase-like protein hydrolase [Candidatus Magasanikbacteria bacterium GW2011_GWA2_56_11]|uniref:Haloacid dehalogenase-like protein hydrolase n=1 Tax=Candidatus Magasanikbacteria bacterium GW2011_GWA2_56_11 TaxID=1619044 RepID=A0A0G1YIL6_9BACT|nr:MAG: Haloacid dehalogenase-like protein hydrolase [Candidatus Magasanikbacteria bacterium GW2011_GWA2_56_11]
MPATPVNTVFTNMEIKGFLFDVDGVLYDSMPQHAKSWAQAFGEEGIKVPAKHVYLCEGMPEVEAAKYLAAAVGARLARKILAKVVERKRDLYNGYKNPEFVPGAGELLAYLRKHKIRVCLVTGSHQLKTIKNIKKDFALKRSEIVTGKDVSRGKPHPEPFLKALKKIKLPPASVLAVENAPLGIESAKRAGLKCAVLKTGLIAKRDLKKCGADWVFKDCRELLQAIKSGDLLKA